MAKAGSAGKDRAANGKRGAPANRASATYETIDVAVRNAVAIVGFDSVSSVASIAAREFASARFCAWLNAAIFFIQCRSAPAQKLSPAPANTTARTPGS